MSDIIVEASEPLPVSPAVDEAYLVGRDGEGHWIAVEVHGLGGGVFTSREAAVRYAQFETARRPGAIRLASEPLSLGL